MSAAFAYAVPRDRPVPAEDIRHIRVVTTSSQRRARPKVFYALVTIAGLFALFIAQLLMSIVISDGAYQISSLNAQQRQLDREQQALTEQLNLLSSPQNLATRAESLGMVLSTTTPVFLRLSDGTIVGPEGASASGDVLVGTTGSLVPNSLLGDLPVAQAESPASQEDNAAVGESSSAPTISAKSSVGSIPSPVTR